jgi:hypothetical protein
MQLKRLGFVMIGGVMASMLSACGGQQVAPSVVAMGSTPSMTKTMPEHTLELARFRGRFVIMHQAA